MSEQVPKPFSVGAIVSADLTVNNAPEVLAFYQAVIGWKTEPVAMEDENGSYSDHVVKNADDGWVGGVCNRRGTNADLPTGWIIYVNVADIAASLEKCIELGGSVLKKAEGEDGTIYYAVIRDPAGSTLALVKT